jgi:hypothetical protein
MEKGAAKLPRTNGFSGRAIRKFGPKPLNLRKLFWCRLRDLNPRPTVYKAPIGSSVGLYFNHLQRLPALSPGPPRHNYGTPNLGSAHSRHRGIAHRS